MAQTEAEKCKQSGGEWLYEQGTGYCKLPNKGKPSTISVINGNRTWRVTYRIGNLIQSLNVFATSQNDAINYAKRIVGNFNLVSAEEFNACSIPTNTITTTRFNY